VILDLLVIWGLPVTLGLSETLDLLAIPDLPVILGLLDL